MTTITRREFVTCVSALGLGATALSTRPLAAGVRREAGQQDQPAMRLGLVTYNWGKDWDLPTLLANCEAAGFEGVELRSTHRHGVEPTLNDAQRDEVKRRFADGKVTLAGLGSACEYQSPDPAVVKQNIEDTKAFVMLCHDIGGEGVKVRPNGLPDGVPVERTLEQIGASLRKCAEFAAGYGVQLRVEVHGRGTSLLPHMRTIMDAADHKNCVVCWNCNATDLDGQGLAHNFKLVQDRMGTIHIHDLRSDTYPWHELFALLKESRFAGWTLLEEGRVPADVVPAMRQNRRLWEQLTGAA